MLIVIAGAGEVGYELAKSLSEKNDVYIIDKDKEKLDRFAELDVITLKGNAGNFKVLKEAKVEKADYFLAVTGNDEVNLISALTAKKLGAKKTFVRIENPEYVETPVVKFHPLGFDVVICPSLALAQEAVRVAGILPAVGVIPLGGEMEILEIQVIPNSNLVGKSVSDLKLPPEILVVSIQRNGEVLPPGIEKIEVGDRIEMLGKDSEIKRFREVFGAPMVKRVTLFGTGNISSYIVEILKESDVAIKIFGASKKACEELNERFKDIKVIFWNYLDVDLLVEEEVGKSDVILAMTDNDEKNLMLSLLCKKLGAKKTIAKVENRAYVEIFEKVGVDKVLNPRAIAVLEVFKQMMMEKIDVKTIAEIRGSAIIEVVVRNEKIANKRISELGLPKNSFVIAVIREEKSFLPYDEMLLKTGDRVLISTPWDKLEKVGEIFQ
ncbi:MAG: Trk system potassium transporter TrkA [Archaeoglobaceae archaeon]|nr:Trk system potassium transporter TrkA [Archaeoglobaceae archaeon]MDW7989881.1 Trk system potassium transporter TrkA [Archaeoglobaceae archaeon]